MQPGGGVSPRSKAHNYRACGRPGRAPIWSKGTSQQMLRPGNWWVTSPIFTPGKDSCTRQAVTVPSARKGLLATPRQGNMRIELVQKALEMAVRNCQPVKGVTIFHVESGERSTRPLTTPPP